ncbi:MAG: TonB-dependent receptor [Sphingomonadales bacterium]|nr:TonB-dependent receptor [Sphingomonadales bacterium]
MRTWKAHLILGTILAGAMPAAVFAQAAPSSAPAASSGDDAGTIIVTARRIEERLQDVPISITVFNPQQIANKNIRDATDLATYTPSLSANNNFGQDNTTFAIRGFVQDIGTAPSVGTYFGDVVVPRGGSNGQPVGDTANAGDFFDIQNVQVLKGPQGTLFGTNTTGGAVLFVPQRPTDKLEGYVQAGLGNYNQWRVQAVINVPLSDSFRIRLGVDRQKQDGYLHNISGIGPSNFNNVDYTAVRLSMVGDLTPNLENYLIASYYRSTDNGGLEKVSAANATQGSLGAPGLGFGALAANQIAQQAGSFYNVENANPFAGLRTTQWQVIDTVSWKATDNVTIKNIASYAQLKQAGDNPIFGVNWPVNVGGTTYNTNFQEAVSPPNLNIADESTFTDELRFQGNTSDDRLTYQGGAYLEVVRPLATVGSQSPGFLSCADGNGNAFNCTDSLAGAIGSAFGIPAAFNPIHVGDINYTVGTTAYRDVGLYSQATYKLTEKLKATAGFRYTWDDESVNTVQEVYQFNAAPNYGVSGAHCFNNTLGQVFPNCTTSYFTKSSAPTWHADLDYNLTRDVMFYGSYSRGYRAGVIVPVIPIGGTAAAPNTQLNYVRPEKVDTYEVGMKSSFEGAVRGTFDITGFYNNFTNQQIQLGFLPINPALYPETAAPVNAGKSKIYGIEVEGTLNPVTGLELSFGYTYLRTRIDQVLASPPSAAYITQASFNVGDPLTLSPRNKLTVGADYTLPTPREWGKLSVGASVTYRSSELANYIDRSNPDPSIAAAGTLPALTLVDANLNWVGVYGKPLDIGLFVTNLTNRQYYNFSAGLGSTQLGFDVSSVGAPRMFGATVKYHFGS